jgi:hypothetical protein
VISSRLVGGAGIGIGVEVLARDNSGADVHRLDLVLQLVLGEVVAADETVPCRRSARLVRIKVSAAQEGKRPIMFGGPMAIRIRKRKIMIIPTQRPLLRFQTDGEGASWEAASCEYELL